MYSEENEAKGQKDRQSISRQRKSKQLRRDMQLLAPLTFAAEPEGTCANICARVVLRLLVTPRRKLL